jgi:hypothetical protein
MRSAMAAVVRLVELLRLLMCGHSYSGVMYCVLYCCC